MATPSESVEIYCLKCRAKTGSRDVEQVDPEERTSRPSRCLHCVRHRQVPHRLRRLNLGPRRRNPARSVHRGNSVGRPAVLPRDEPGRKTAQRPGRRRVSVCLHGEPDCENRVAHGRPRYSPVHRGRQPRSRISTLATTLRPGRPRSGIPGRRRLRARPRGETLDGQNPGSPREARRTGRSWLACEGGAGVRGVMVK